jgi:hypothetical protein
VVALRAGARELRRTLRVEAAPSPPARRPPRREPHSLADAQQTETGAVSGEELEAEAASVRAHKPGGPVSANGVTLFDPKDPVRSVDDGATITYQLTAPAQSVSLTVIDSRGRTVRTLTGLPVDPGVHNVTWNLRFTGPVSYPGLVFWAANPTSGPKAPLGRYTVRLQADATKLSQGLRILKDPRLTSISAADIEQQYRLAQRIVDRESQANQAVLNIRACTGQVDARVASANDPAVSAAGQALDAKLAAVSDAIHQGQIVSTQDALNYPIRLDNKIAALLGVVEGSDDRPTDQDVAVFEFLSGQLGIQLAALGAIVSSDVPAFNNLLGSKGQPPISCAA